jgi:hypothetical protein
LPKVLLPDEQALHQHLSALIIQQREARYHELLLAPRQANKGVIYSQRRAGSGLIALALEHRALSPAQHQALGEFRLQQYLACGWYDSQRVAQQGLQTDPALAQLPATTIHVLVGTEDGRLLAYFAMQEASVQPPNAGSHTLGKAVFLDDPDRPLFASESELFGPNLFASLPALRRIPLTEMRELSCLLRNQAIVSPLSVIAVVEAVYTMTHLVMRRNASIRVLLGGVGLEARQVTASLGIPILYSPLAPVIKPSSSAEPDVPWAEGEHAQGKFWPFVIALDDLQAHHDHFRQLDRLLSGSEQELRRALVRFRRQRQALAPQALVPPAGESSLLWTSDPD